jgi:hypothetical protein
MIRFLVKLMDGQTVKLLAMRLALQAAAAAVILFGLLFLLASAFQALVQAVGGAYASLIFGFAFVILGAILFIVGGIVWKRRPRHLVPLAKLGAMSQALEIAKIAIRREPAKAIIAGVVLGAVAELMAKPPKRRRD